MKVVPSLALTATCALIAACASTSPASSTGSTSAAPQTAPSAQPAQAAKPAAQASPYGPTRLVKSRDGSFEGEIIGTPARNSRFAKLQIGMPMEEVTSLIGGPDNIVRHETGKRWIPFYFGSDAQRMQAYYRGEGCLTYTGGNVFGGGGNTLIRITANPQATCAE